MSETKVLIKATETEPTNSEDTRKLLETMIQIMKDCKEVYNTYDEELTNICDMALDLMSHTSIEQIATEETVLHMYTSTYGTMYHYDKLHSPKRFVEALDAQISLRRISYDFTGEHCQEYDDFTEDLKESYVTLYKIEYRKFREITTQLLTMIQTSYKIRAKKEGME